MEKDNKYPLTLIGMYKNGYSEKFSAQSMPLDQERANSICDMIQKAVGGRILVKQTNGGLSKNGKKMPDFFLEATTPAIEAERQAFAAQKKAERDGTSSTMSSGDAAL